MKKERPEYILRMLWNENLKQEYGTPINDSVFRDAIKQVQETRWERNLFMILFMVSFISMVVLACFI